MKVIQLSFKKNGFYEVKIDEKTYLLAEEIILKYRLLENKEVSKALLPIIEQENKIQKLEHQAYLYAYRYGKSTGELLQYLQKKDIAPDIAQGIIKSLVDKKLLNDALLAQNLASSYARNSNGPKVIQYKLHCHLFPQKIIEEALQSVSEEDYSYGLEKLRKKALKQYEKLSGFQQRQKIKMCFYRHGYSEIIE